MGAAEAGTLDEIFRRNVSRRPDAFALLDPPDRATFTDGAPRRLTYAQADRAVAALAHRLRTFGLPADAVVALQLPNTVEAVVALLAILRAGLVAAPIPLLWRKAEASAALGRASARALIACARIADVDHGEVALQIAADTFSIRVVCGFGTNLPDGLVPLDDIFAHNCGDRGTPAHADDADRVSVITFDAVRDGFHPTPRTDTELLVGGVTTLLEARIERHASILSTLLMPSFAALATSIVPWLLSGGTLALHQPFDPLVVAQQSAQAHVDVIVLPGPLVQTLAQAGLIGGAEGPNTILSVWRAPERQAMSPAWSGHASLVDVLVFGEVGLLAARRGADGRPATIAAGAITAPRGAEGAPVVMTVARTAAGTLALFGPMVARRAFAAAASSGDAGAPPVDTGYACRIERETNTLILTGAPPGLVSIGGYRFALRELQDLIGRVDANSVLAALPDMLAGQKLAGSTSHPAALRDVLDALGINPLIGAAFRDRRDKQAPAA